MDLSAIIEFDKQLLLQINGSDSLFLDGVMTMLTSGWFWAPLYLAFFYVVVKNNDTMAQIMLTVGGALLCILIAGGVTEGIVKPLVGRLRPCNDLSIKYLVDTVSGVSDKNFSFFSAHAANLCSLATFFSLLMRDWRLSIGLGLWAAVSCYTRLYLGMHYPSDILVGIIFGLSVGCFSYRLYLYVYNRMIPRAGFVSTQYTSSGYSLADIDVILTVMAFLFVLSVFYSLCYL